jgi:hypothetical protein
VAEFERTPGLRVEAIGMYWVAFSHCSGETLVLNDGAAAILELLAMGPAAPEAIATQLASETSTPLPQMTEMVLQCWPGLLDAGVIQAVRHWPASPGA